jgi:hypothetical protein
VSSTGSVLALSRRATWPALLRFPFRIAADTRRPPPLVTRCGKGPDTFLGSPEFHASSHIVPGRASWPKSSLCSTSRKPDFSKTLGHGRMSWSVPATTMLTAPVRLRLERSISCQ